MATKKQIKTVEEEELKEVELQNQSEDKMDDLLPLENANMKGGN